MTAEALVCREFLGLSLPGAADEASNFLLSQLPGSGATNFYYWYYGTLAMFQLQGEQLVEVEPGHELGSDAEPTSRGGASRKLGSRSRLGRHGGRVFSTSLGLCAWKSTTVICRSIPRPPGREKSAK